MLWSKWEDSLGLLPLRWYFWGSRVVVDFSDGVCRLQISLDVEEDEAVKIGIRVLGFILILLKRTLG